MGLGGVMPEGFPIILFDGVNVGDFFRLGVERQQPVTPHLTEPIDPWHEAGLIEAGVFG